MTGNADPRQIVSEIKARWRQEGAPDAARCLDRHPLIKHQKSLVLELAYEEFCLREESGDPVNIATFCDRFPSVCHSLQRQLEVHKFFQSHPDLMDSATKLPWPRPGELFLGFRILEELGRGGLARVFLCSQPMVGDRQVVIKIAHHGAYEADTLGRLKHPNIVPVYAVVEDEPSGMSGISMPFCGRSTLCDVLDLAFAETTLPQGAQVIVDSALQHAHDQDRYDRVETPDRRMRSASYTNGVLHLGMQLADALQHAHDQDILHGDLKPSNILVTPSGRPMLLDFNLSHNQRRPAVMTGGTLPYMSPEQVRNTVLKSPQDEDRIDERSDIYSLGTILYELLCGQLPYGPVVEPMATIDLAHQRLAAQQMGHPSLAQRSRAVDQSLASFIDQCLAYDRASRPDCMATVVQRLSRHLNPRRRAARWARVNRRAVLASAAGLVLAGGCGSVFVLTRDPYSVRQFNLGVDHYRRGQLDAAVTHLRHATDDDPAFAEAHYRLGRTYIKLGELAQSQQSDQAKVHFENARQVFARLGDLRDEGRDDACRGYCLSDGAADRRWSEPAKRYRDALDKGYQTVGVYNNLGYCKYRLGLLDEAGELLVKALTWDKTCRVSYFNLAQVELQRARITAGYVPTTGIDAIEHVIDSTSDRHAHVYCIAAQLFGYAAGAFPEYDQRCVNSLRIAVADGRRPRWADIAADPAFHSIRNRHPQETQQLLSRPEASLPLAPFPSLLDPIDDDLA